MEKEDWGFLPVAPMPTADDGYCSEREDGTHCDHWWDGEDPCCACGHKGGER